MANMDERGYIKITDRVKDIIKVGGEWVSSLELEDIIHQHPSVKEVAVIGVEDEKWGERPLALVVLDPTKPTNEKELLIHAKEFIKKVRMVQNESLSDLKVLSIKDYIKNPKESGYKSYHMLVSVPIFLSDSVVDTKVEIQIRTIAMDFWASLEHKIYYKFEGNAPDYISRELKECAKMVSELDDKMLSLNEAIQACMIRDDQRKESMEDVFDNVIGERRKQ